MLCVRVAVGGGTQLCEIQRAKLMQEGRNSGTRWRSGIAGSLPGVLLRIMIERQITALAEK